MQLNNLNKDGKITIFVPIRRGSKRIKNKNIKALPGFRMGLTELKIKQLNKLRLKCKKNRLLSHFCDRYFRVSSIFVIHKITSKIIINLNTFKPSLYYFIIGNIS